MHGLTFMLLLLHHLWISIELFKTQVRDFPGSLVVKTSPSNAGGASLIPGQGTKIPHASWPKYQNVKQKRYCNKFSKNLKKKKRHKSLHLCSVQTSPGTLCNGENVLCAVENSIRKAHVAMDKLMCGGVTEDLNSSFYLVANFFFFGYTAWDAGF